MYHLILVIGVLVCSMSSWAMDKAKIDADVLARQLEGITGHRFSNASYIDQVFLHPGAYPDNQLSFKHLELRGDKLLGLVIMDHLCNAYPKQDEGYLTQKCSDIVSDKNNAMVADQIGLSKFIRLNNIHNISGEGKEGLVTIKAGTCEALIGAIYRDGGQAAAASFILRYWKIHEPQTATALPWSTAAVPNAHYREFAMFPAIKSAVLSVEDKKEKKLKVPPLETYRREHKLPTHQYEWLTEEAPFRVRICYADQPFTEVFEAYTKAEARKLVSENALQRLRNCNFTKLDGGKSAKRKAILASLQKHAVTYAKPRAQCMADAMPVAALSATTEPVAIGASVALYNVTPNKLLGFPAVISYKNAKEKLQELCKRLCCGTPVYTTLVVANSATVTITKYGSHYVNGAKAEKLAAKEMYYKITGEHVSMKRAKTALQTVCTQRDYGVPQYISEKKGIYKVKVAAGSLTMEADSIKSKIHAEKLAAKKLYETLHHSNYEQ